MKQVSISEFKAKCVSLIEKVNKTKEPLRITRHGKPVAEIVPPSSTARKGKLIGSGMKTFDILDQDIVGPIIDFQ